MRVRTRSGLQHYQTAHLTWKWDKVNSRDSGARILTTDFVLAGQNFESITQVLNIRLYQASWVQELGIPWYESQSMSRWLIFHSSIDFSWKLVLLGSVQYAMNLVQNDRYLGGRYILALISHAKLMYWRKTQRMHILCSPFFYWTMSSLLLQNTALMEIFRDFQTSVPLFSLFRPRILFQTPWIWIQILDLSFCCLTQRRSKTI